MRQHSLVARWAHNPKVGGSNPSPATHNKTLSYQRENWGFLLSWKLISAVLVYPLIYPEKGTKRHK